MTFEGNIVDVVANRLFHGRIVVEGKQIASVETLASEPQPAATWFMPGFVDAHVHIESSMLAPTEFARAATIHGTVATVSDPHEIANVCGLDGVRWMVDNGKQSPFKFHFGAPSCVPATSFETAGTSFGPEEIATCLDLDTVGYLAEVMNFPAVIGREKHMMAIIEVARQRGVRIDGHAPGVTGDALKQYASAGIKTDHECVTLDEGRQRCTLGMHVAIREGSAAKNFESLWQLLNEFPDNVFFCSDDKHPDDLVVSHINALIQRAVAYGATVLTAIRAATLNPVRHYGLPVGLLQTGDPADFIEVADLESFRVERTFIDGECVAEKGAPRLSSVPVKPINKFACTEKQPEDFTIRAEGERYAAMVAIDGQLITGTEHVSPKIEDGKVLADPDRDLLKIAVVNRYSDAPPAVGLIKNFGLKSGAIAGSVAHDSHNIVAVGVNDEQLCRAVNLVIKEQGGLSFASPTEEQIYPLPIAGLMGTGNAWNAAEAFETLTQLARQDGCPLGSPYMTLSFMALLVIPQLKIGDKGHFDVNTFSLVSPWA